MPAPTVVTIRTGVTFTPAAASSFRRVEAAWGRRVDVNSTYRDWNKQWGMYTAWNAYAAGRGPHPGHSRAIHPNRSKHCQGLAIDSDDWTRPGFIGLMAAHGWIRTAANDPTERHHFEYQSWRDKHRGDPTPAGDNITVIDDQGDSDMYMIYNLDNSNEDARRAVVGPLSFDVVTKAESDAERKGLPPVVNVTRDEWLTIHRGVGRRLAEFNRMTGATVTANTVAAIAAALHASGSSGAPATDAATIAAALEAAIPKIAAEFIEQMKLPGN